MTSGQRKRSVFNSMARATSAGNSAAAFPTIAGADRYRDLNCWTADYVAGPNEHALITASMGVVLSSSSWLDFIAMYTVNGGTPGGLGNGWTLQTSALDQSATVHGIVDLVEGSTYRFGLGIVAYSNGITTNTHPCQTLVQIVTY